MPAEDEPEDELVTLLTHVDPQIADLLLRMMENKPANWAEAKGLRDEIIALNHIAKTDEEQTALLFAFNSLMDDAISLVDPESVEQLGKLRAADYRMMLNVQAMTDGFIFPDKLDYITQREVECGRLASDDDFRMLAVNSMLIADLDDSDDGPPVAEGPQAMMVSWLPKLNYELGFKRLGLILLGVWEALLLVRCGQVLLEWRADQSANGPHASFGIDAAMGLSLSDRLMPDLGAMVIPPLCIVAIWFAGKWIVKGLRTN